MPSEHTRSLLLTLSLALSGGAAGADTGKRPELKIS